MTMTLRQRVTAALVEANKERGTYIVAERLAEIIVSSPSMEGVLVLEDMPWVCAYCGQETPGGQDYITAGLSAHVKTCDKHPLAKAKKDVSELAYILRTVVAKGIEPDVDRVLAKHEALLKEDLVV